MQIFSGENKKNISKCHLKFYPSMLSVNSVRTVNRRRAVSSENVSFGSPAHAHSHPGLLSSDTYKDYVKRTAKAVIRLQVDLCLFV